MKEFIVGMLFGLMLMLNIAVFTFAFTI